MSNESQVNTSFLNLVQKMTYHGYPIKEADRIRTIEDIDLNTAITAIEGLTFYAVRLAVEPTVQTGLEALTTAQDVATINEKLIALATEYPDAIKAVFGMFLEIDELDRELD